MRNQAVPRVAGPRSHPAGRDQRFLWSDPDPDRRRGRDLRAGRLDALVAPTGHGSADLRTLELGDEDGVVLVGAGHPLAGIGSVDAEDLQGQRIAVTGHRDGAVLDRTVSDLLAELSVAAQLVPGAQGPAREAAVAKNEALILTTAPDAVPSGGSRVQSSARTRSRRCSACCRKRHREVIVRRYGLSGDGAQTHEQIGERLGVGEERSRQIEGEALHRLRSIVTAPARAAWQARGPPAPHPIEHRRFVPTAL
jgi:Sigma-70, region 4/LysR substrate binding domain